MFFKRACGFYNLGKDKQKGKSKPNFLPVYVY